MLYWETADQDPSLDDAMLEWAAIWKPLPKVVFSATLPAVQGNARLASGGLAKEIERLRAEPAEGDIAIGGATLAAEAAALGLIDEYRARVYPVLVGGGIPFFASAAPGGSRTRRDPHLQLGSRLPAPPGGALGRARSLPATSGSGPATSSGRWPRRASQPAEQRQADDAVARGGAVAECRYRRRDPDPFCRYPRHRPVGRGLLKAV